MGGALAMAVAKAVGGGNLLLADHSREKAETLADRLGAKVGTNADAAAQDFVVLGVKPQMLAGMMAEIAPVLQARTAKGESFVLVTMAAGQSMEKIRSLSGTAAPVIRIMPNTPVSIGKGVILYDGMDVKEGQWKDFLAAVSACGAAGTVA